MQMLENMITSMTLINSAALFFLQTTLEGGSWELEWIIILLYNMKMCVFL